MMNGNDADPIGGYTLVPAPKRWKRLVYTSGFVVELAKKGLHEVLDGALPEDAYAVETLHDVVADRIETIVHSDSWPEIAEGAEIPVVATVQMRRTNGAAVPAVLPKLDTVAPKESVW